MSRFDYDLFVIGAGSGGVRAARMSATYGARVAVAEEYRVGGTCVIRGCVPKKLLVYASRYSEEFEDSVGFGWSKTQSHFDWKTLIANKDREIARLESIYRKNVEATGTTIIADRAILKDAHTIHLVGENRDVTAAKILIATGGHPWFPETLPGCEHAISSNEAFQLPELPKHVVIAGAGYIAVEFAGIFHGLGAEVTLVNRSPTILRGFDHDIRDSVKAEMERRGIKLILGTVFERIDVEMGTKRIRLANGQTLQADTAMMAVGRIANTRGLGLDAIGVELTPAGGVIVDEFGQTNVPNIYAIGDVTDRLHLTPVAIRDGAAFAETVFHHKPTSVDRMCVPTAVFGTPEIATVGMCEETAREGGPVDIYRTTFRPMKATMSGRDTKMTMKLVVDGATDRVLGCHIVGEGAAEMIQCLAIAVKMRATKADFDSVVALHPTAAEELVLLKTKVTT